jgi:Na+-translocating ferredoxin:NAD+ oxidoreductase RnfC subunit
MNLKEAVFAAGIVGEGGAGFPAHVKIDCRADVVIANGAECEPLLRTDRHLMRLYAAEAVRGLELVVTEVGAKRGVIALKKHYKDAVDALTANLSGTPAELFFLHNYYPSGDEQQVVRAVTGRVVPLGGLPKDVGAVVCNVGTLIDVARAERGIPVTEKCVTVGGAVAEPQTLMAPLGTPFHMLIEAAGGSSQDCDYIAGGPCMGVPTDLDQVVTKTIGGLLAFPKDHPLWRMRGPLNERVYRRMRSMCSQCNRCTQMCPRHALGLGVSPHMAMRAVCWGRPELLGDADAIFGCCECGLCTYFACDFGLDPAGVMKMLRKHLTAEGKKPEKRTSAGPEDWFGRQVPPSRLMARLGIADYDVPVAMKGTLAPESVRIPLRMHAGSPSAPVVRAGDAVKKGELIAAPSGLGANIHASLTGHVTKITPAFIEIKVGVKAGIEG